MLSSRLWFGLPGAQIKVSAGVIIILSDYVYQRDRKLRPAATSFPAPRKYDRAQRAAPRGGRFLIVRRNIQMNMDLTMSPKIVSESVLRKA